MAQIYDPVLDQWIESDTGETTQRQGERASETQPPGPAETTDRLPDDSPENHDTQVYDANSDTWHKTGMDFDAIKRANETTQVLYRIDGKILEKPESLRAPDGGPSEYESPYPARLPPGFKTREARERETEKADRSDILKVGRNTDNPESIILTESLKELRDSKDALDRKLYRILVNDGVAAFDRAVNAEKFTRQQEGERGKRLAAAEKTAFEKSLADKPAELQEAYRKGGLAAYNKAVEAYNKNLEQTGVRLPDGYYIPDDSFRKLPDKYAVIALTKGYGAMDKAIEADIKAQDLALKELEPYKRGDNYDIVKYLSDPKAGQRSWKETQLENAGFSQSDIKKTEEYIDKGFVRNMFEALGDRIDVPPDAQYEYKGNVLSKAEYIEVARDYQKKLTAKIEEFEKDGMPTGAAVKAARIELGPAPNSKLTKDSAAKMVDNYKEFAKEVGIPFYGPLKNKNEYTSSQLAFWLAVDAAGIFALGSGLARAGVTAGRVATSTATTGAKAAFARAAAKGMAGELAEQTLAPVTILLHPAQTAKAAVNSARDVAEDILDPRKVSRLVLSTSDSTLRIPITNKMSEAEAMAARDLIMETYGKKGGRVFAQVGDTLIEVQESPFMREVRSTSGAYATATPDITPFEKPVMAEYKPGQRALEQGIFFANEPLERFALSTARGVRGERPGFYIVSDATIQKMRSSEKLYLDTAELERVLPMGKTTVGPKQKLYTRIGPDSVKTEILLEKPLSPEQLLRLKVKAIPQAVSNLMTPGIELKGSGPGGALTADEFNDLVRELRASGNTDISGRLVYAERFSRSMPRTRELEPRPGSRASQRNMAEARDRILERSRDLDRLSRYDEPVRRSLRDDRAELRRNISPVGRTELSRRELRQSAERRRELLQRIERSGGRQGTERADDRRTNERGNRSGGREPIRTERVMPVREPLRIGRERLTPEQFKPRRTTLPTKIMGRTDKETRKMIARSSGAIAWRQGELNGQDRWDVITNIYKPGNEQYAIVIGKAPQGVTIVKGPGSARRTAQYLYGKQPLKQTSVIDQPGLFTTRLDPITGRKVQLSFVRDADISGKSPSISQKGSIFPLAGQNARKTV